MKMDTSRPKLDTQLLSDLLMIAMVMVLTILFFEYYDTLEEEITTAVLNSIHDINNSIAETRVGS
ncbi:hypothetical protein [Maribacter thermophilus]|uniref:hypothetical protein n=1 Tax=Maribacter thermophilus TaxID=1197874 RepID=UPI000640E5DA|nr:hypothetical protein [Maribacter thermophilus]